MGGSGGGRVGEGGSAREFAQSRDAKEQERLMGGLLYLEDVEGLTDTGDTGEGSGMVCTGDVSPPSGATSMREARALRSVARMRITEAPENAMHGIVRMYGAPA